MKNGIAAVALPVLLALCPSLGWAEPTAVRFAETATHGFLTLKNDHGEILADGELVQAPRQDTVESRMIFRFKDDKGLFVRATGGFYHDSRFEDLKAVVGHYNRVLNLALTPTESSDLVEYLKSI